METEHCVCELEVCIFSTFLPKPQLRIKKEKKKTSNFLHIFTEVFVGKNKYFFHSNFFFFFFVSIKSTLVIFLVFKEKLCYFAEEII